MLLYQLVTGKLPFEGEEITLCRAVKLLGARFILTGIRTEVAQTLIRLGIDLSALLTHSTLQSGIAFAMAQSVRST